ncbi:hypothetical protein LCGC14_2575410 [marine sediment metagenome]|uniref:Uncharacterized protein n=1 Tax=marine sediment metagenome TaxID=412755 RepID=A0A0F9B3X4_9ZZZZ
MVTLKLYEEAIEKGELCVCGGEIDILGVIQKNPDIWSGRCFVCGVKYTIVSCQSMN